MNEPDIRPVFGPSFWTPDERDDDWGSDSRFVGNFNSCAGRGEHRDVTDVRSSWAQDNGETRLLDLLRSDNVCGAPPSLSRRWGLNAAYLAVFLSAAFPSESCTGEIED